MFIRNPNSRWGRASAGAVAGIEEIFAPYSYEVKMQQEAEQVIPVKREDDEPKDSFKK